MVMKYIVAVSGGVDSMVLLDILKRNSPHELVVAHVDHEIRSDSYEDAELVCRVALSHGLKFETVRLGLGADTSEATARKARYKWLDGVKKTHKADTVVTAHHQDDVIETVILNLIRGTGWRGLASLRSSGGRLRPLLKVPKAELVRYAIEHNLEWREDTTNDDLRYLRNQIRHGIIPKLTREQKSIIMQLFDSQNLLRKKIESEVELLASVVKTPDGLSRYQLTMLPDEVALEVLRQTLSSRLVPAQTRRLLWFTRTAQAGSHLTAGDGLELIASRRFVQM